MSEEAAPPTVEQILIADQAGFDDALAADGVFEKGATKKMDPPPTEFKLNTYYSNAAAETTANPTETEGEVVDTSKGDVNSGGGDIGKFVDEFLKDAMALKEKDGLTLDHIIAGAERMNNNAKPAADKGGRRRSKRRQPKRSAKQSKKGGRSRKNRRKQSRRRKH